MFIAPEHIHYIELSFFPHMQNVKIKTKVSDTLKLMSRRSTAKRTLRQRLPRIYFTLLIETHRRAMWVKSLRGVFVPSWRHATVHLGLPSSCDACPQQEPHCVRRAMLAVRGGRSGFFVATIVPRNGKHHVTKTAKGDTMDIWYVLLLWS